MVLTMAPAAFAVGDAEDASTSTDAITLSPASIVPAPIVDHSSTAETELYDAGSYQVKVPDTLTTDDDINKIEISVQNLKEHTNANDAPGYWCGFSVVAPENATKMKYAFATSLDELDSLKEAPFEENVDDKGGQGIAFYVDAGAKTPKTYCAVQFLTDDESSTTGIVKFQMDLTGVSKYSPTESNTVYPAILNDKDGDPSDLYESYEVTSSPATDGVVNVAIQAKGLKKHTNAADKEGYWVGFALAAPENATKVKYAFANSEDTLTLGEAGDLEKNVTADGKSGIAFYADAGDANANTWAKVQWVGADDKLIGPETTYQMNLDGVTMVVDDLKAATLHDTSGEIADEDLYTSYTLTASKTGTAPYQVKISAENLRPHQNSNASYGAWVGVAIPAPAGATQFKYSWDDQALSNSAYGLEQIFDNEWGVAAYVDASKGNTSFNVQWLDGSSSVVSTAKYDIDVSGVQVKPVTISKIAVAEAGADSTFEASEAVIAAVENNAIKLTGAVNSDTTKLQLTFTTDANGSLIKEFTLTQADGSLTITPETVTVAGQAYSIDISNLAVLAADIAPATGATAVDTSSLPENMSKEDTEAVTAAAESVQVTDTSLNAAAAAAAAYITEDQKEELLASTDIESAQLYVQAYLAVTPQDYSAQDKVMQLDIQPMYQIIASNAATASDIVLSADEGKVVNAEIVQKPSELTVTVATTISVGLPAGFVENTDDAVYVYHEKGNKTYVYKANVSEAEGSYTATFTNPHGFSTFTVKTSAAASIDGTYYASLQDAVDAVEDNQTITLLADGTATVSKPITFKVDTNNKQYTATINPGTGYDVKPEVNGNVTTYTVTEKDGGGSSSSGGGSSSSSGYSVTVPSVSNGTVSVSPKNAAKGKTVTVTVKPNTGYELSTLTVTDNAGDAVTLTKVSDTEYTFTMPASRVTVRATFAQVAQQPTEPEMAFTDVAAGAYYYDAVKWAVEEGITSGTTATTFSPNASCTRAQMVSFLWRANGSPKATGANPFIDVAADTYYYDAVLWAVEQGITSGTSATTFSPNATVTRAQTVSFLHREAGSPATTGANPFADVAADTYYAAAVQWAVANNITAGTTASTFSPDSACTRGQIVSFLYRAQ